MSELNGILSNPYRRTKSMYHFKVTAFEGNVVKYHDATKVTTSIELPNTSERTLEEQYGDNLDNIFIAVSSTGQYFFYTKLSNDANWPDFNR